MQNIILGELWKICVIAANPERILDLNVDFLGPNNFTFWKLSVLLVFETGYIFIIIQEIQWMFFHIEKMELSDKNT